MISAFKHIRLSGYNLTPVQGSIYDGSSTLRLGFGNSGLAYYSELTGISGYLMSQINSASADVSKLNNLQGDLYITGQDGIRIEVDAGLGEIKIVGNSGYFQALTNSLSDRLNQSGTTYYDTFVKKSTQQVFDTALNPTNLDAYAIIYPTPFASAPKIQATLEVQGDVMYNLSVRSIGTNGYTGILSDNVLEAGAKIHTYASL